MLDIPNNRSNTTVALAYRVNRKLSARGSLSWQHTHGGLRSVDLTTPERIAEHDRLLRDDNLHAGAGVSYELPRVDLFASYIGFVSGTDTHAGRGLTMGVSWPFELRRREAGTK